MANEEQKQEQRQGLPKMVGLKDEPYYANCLTVEMTPFDLSILFGKVRPVKDSNGQGQLVEMYDRQVYLSHLQARALYEGLGRSLSALNSSSAGIGIRSATKDSKQETGRIEKAGPDLTGVKA